MPVQREIQFVLSPESDQSFQEALQQLKDNFSTWTLKELRRDVPEGNAGVPLGTIVVELSE